MSQLPPPSEGILRTMTDIMEFTSKSVGPNWLKRFAGGFFASGLVLYGANVAKNYFSEHRDLEEMSRVEIHNKYLFMSTDVFPSIPMMRANAYYPMKQSVLNSLKTDYDRLVSVHDEHLGIIYDNSWKFCAALGLAVSGAGIPTLVALVPNLYFSGNIFFSMNRLAEARDQYDDIRIKLAANGYPPDLPREVMLGQNENRILKRQEITANIRAYNAWCVQNGLQRVYWNERRDALDLDQPDLHHHQD